jgi:hypothetical protein
MFRHDAAAFSATCTDSMLLSGSLTTSNQCPQASELSVAESPYALNERNKKPSPSSSLYSPTSPLHLTWSSCPSASIGQNASTKDCTSEADDSLEILERDFEDPFSNGTSFTLARYTENYIQQVYYGQHPARQNSVPEVSLLDQPSSLQTTGIERHQSSTYPPIFALASCHSSMLAPGPPLVANALYTPQSYYPTGSESSAGRVFAPLDSNKVHQAASTSPLESSLLPPYSYVPSPSSSQLWTHTGASSTGQFESDGPNESGVHTWHVSLQVAYERLRDSGNRDSCPMKGCKDVRLFTISELKSHLRVVHYPNTSSICACPFQGIRSRECQDLYEQRSLIRHILQCHFVKTDTKIHCRYRGCEAKFTRLDSAQRHFRARHVRKDGQPKTNGMPSRC